MVGVRMMSLMLMMFSCLNRSRFNLTECALTVRLVLQTDWFSLWPHALYYHVYTPSWNKETAKNNQIKQLFFLGYKTLSCSFVIIIHYSNIKENHTNNIKCIPSDTKIKSTRYKKFNTMWMQIGLSIMGTFLWTFRKAALKHFSHRNI